MSFWIGYGIAVISLPFGAVLTEWVLEGYERLSGYRGLPGPRPTRHVLTAALLSGSLLVLTAAGIWWVLT